MGLSTFFGINMPYGIKRNQNNEWFAFNREYMPIGWNSISHAKSIFTENVYSEFPIYTKYKGLTDALLRDLAWSENGIVYDDNGEIQQVFFYNDKTSPINHGNNWSAYLQRLKILGKLKTTF